jgi:hypothetical protein
MNICRLKDVSIDSHQGIGWNILSACSAKKGALSMSYALSAPDAESRSSAITRHGQEAFIPKKGYPSIDIGISFPFLVSIRRSAWVKEILPSLSSLPSGRSSICL